MPAPTVARAGALLQRHRWLPPLLLYGASRLYMAFFMVAYARFFSMDLTFRTPNRSDYWTVVMTWDSDWYRAIAETGYPAAIPVSPEGVAAKSEWAFYPLWPLLCRCLMLLTGLPYYAVAGILALLLGALAAVVLHSLARSLGLSQRLSMVLLAFLFFAPTGVVFSLAYPEALALLLLSLTLWLVQRERYAWAALPIGLLAFTRPLTLALALALLAHVLFLRRHRGEGAAGGSPKRARQELLLAAWAALSFLAWPLTTAVYFKRWDAYFFIQGAWRQYYRPSFAAEVPWRIASDPAVVLLALVSLGLVLLSVLQWRRGAGFTWPLLLRCWALGYLLFLWATVPSATRMGLNGSADFYPSVLRYLTLLLIPFLPIALGEWIQRRGLRRVWWFSLALVNLFATALYFRYFVVLELPKAHYWL